MCHSLVSIQVIADFNVVRMLQSLSDVRGVQVLYIVDDDAEVPHHSIVLMKERRS